MADSRFYIAWRQRYAPRPNAAAPANNARIRNRLNAMIALGEVAANNQNSLRRSAAQYDAEIDRWIRSNPERIEEVLPIIVALHPDLLAPAAAAAAVAPAQSAQSANLSGAQALQNMLRAAPAPMQPQLETTVIEAIEPTIQELERLTNIYNFHRLPIGTVRDLVMEGEISPKNQEEINRTLEAVTARQGLRLGQVQRRAQLAEPFLLFLAYAHRSWPRSWRILLTIISILNGNYSDEFLAENIGDMHRRLSLIREGEFAKKTILLAQKKCEARNIIHVRTLNNRKVGENRRNLPRNVLRKVLNYTRRNIETRHKVNYEKYNSMMASLKSECERLGVELNAQRAIMDQMYDTFDEF